MFFCVFEKTFSRHILKAMNGATIYVLLYFTGHKSQKYHIERGYRMLQKSKLKQKLKNNEIVLQAMLRLPDPAIAEIVAMSGVDFITIDGEHFGFDDETIYNLIRAVNLHGAECMMRVHELDPCLISKLMDMGLTGILVPHVESYEDAKRIVDAVKFAPVGKRGFCPISRANHWGMTMTAQEYAEFSNQNTVIAVMIETKSGVEDLDRILTIPEIDTFSIGPSDISNSYGFPGQVNHPIVQAAISEAQEKIMRAGKSLCTLAYTPEAAEAALAQGIHHLHLGSDLQILTRTFSQLVSDVKKLY